jgi:hypothetical protein
MNESYLNKLLDDYLGGKLNHAERETFLRMLKEEKYRALLNQRFSETWNVAESEYIGDNTDLRIRKNILDKIQSQKEVKTEISYRL